MTKKDLQVMVNEHENKAATYFHNENNNSGYFEKGLATALAFIVEHFDELYLGQRRQNLVEDAEDHIYSYFESRYDGDDSDELPETLEERYQRALNEGDAERLAEIFQNKYDCNISEDFQWDAIVEDFYDFYDE